MSASISTILTDPVLRKSAERRLLDNVRRDPSRGCWEWQRAANRKGYAVIRVLRRPHGSSLASRVSYTLFCGPVPDGVLVLHRCDNPKCVNPTHLFLGTHDENMADMVAKGRSRSVEGERSKFAKITEEDVAKIRSRYAAGESPAAIGNDYGMTFTGIIMVARGKSWSHVPGACKSRGYAKKTKMTQEQLSQASKLHRDGWSYKRLGQMYGVAPGTVHRLLTKGAGVRS